LRDLLRRRGLSQDEVEREVQRQKAWIATNFTSELDVLMFKAHSMGFGCVDLDRIEPNREAVQIAPAELVRFHQIAPVKKDGTNLYVAMVDPAELTAIEAIQTVSGCRIIPVMATPRAIANWIERYYPDEA
jgi:type IV pilus assembly protein PilB